MHPRSLALAALAAATLALPSAAQGQTLSKVERGVNDWILAHQGDEIAALQQVVDISSGTMNPAGVRAVGDVFAARLRALGFTVRWVAMPESMHRAGHLVAERKGKRGKRILLIGHLDTVSEGEGQRFVRVDSITASGAGSSDMKGGDIAILYALEALASKHALDNATITVVMTGDEESAGDPLATARAALIDAAKQSDVALAFEGGRRGEATVARRGASSWLLRVTGKQAHSSGIFGNGTGYGAVYEMARILDGFRTRLAGEPNLTFNPAVVVGGTDVTYDTLHVAGTTATKLNIVARSAVVNGDLRFLTEEQKEHARAVMREVVAENLPGTSAEITFADEYPAMAPTEANHALLAQLDTVSRALGHGPVVALDPSKRGAGDVSFVAPLVPGLDGLGVDGRGAHTPQEQVNLRSMIEATQRAAILIYRLTR